jgi:hypothetical protein
VVDRGVPEIGSDTREAGEEAAPDPRIGAASMGRAIGVRFDPHGEQLEVGLCIRVDRGQPLGVGIGDLTAGRRDDLGVGSGGHGLYSDKQLGRSPRRCGNPVASTGFARIGLAVGPDTLGLRSGN